MRAGLLERLVRAALEVLSPARLVTTGSPRTENLEYDDRSTRLGDGPNH